MAIPSTINGLPVTSIGNKAFYDCGSLTSVTIPNSVTNIGSGAFSSCTNLMSVTIPKSVTYIGMSAFRCCSNLTNVTIGNGVIWIDYSAFEGCTSLTSVTIPNSVTCIGWYAFSSCTNLTGIYFKGNAPSVGSDVFADDNKATVYYLPGTTCWDSTFAGRPTKLWTPQAQASDAFLGVRTNQFGFNINWTSGMTVVVEGSTDLANPTWLPLQTNTLTGDSFYFSDPNWTNYLARFYRLRSLLSALPYTYATNHGTISITGYTDPGGPITIPCTITGLPVTSIGDGAFQWCTNLTSVTIPNSVTYIGVGAFSGCSSLTSVTIPDSVLCIGDKAFEQCSSLTSITIPGSVYFTPSSAFRECTSLTSIEVDYSNPFYSSVDGVVFNKSGNVLILCPQGKAGRYTIPNSVTSIGYRAFADCTRLTSVTIPSSVTNYGILSFEGCTNLTSMMIDMTTICTEFSGSESLTNLIIGGQMKSISLYPFSFCASLTAITVNAFNSVFSSSDGVLFDKNRTTLIICPAGKAGSYTIPNSVTSIGGSAFNNCSSLTNVTIPDSVTSIGEWAFDGCIRLTGVYFKGNAPSLVGDAFSGADNVTVYYLAGTTGWGPTFSGRPTGLWNP